MSGTNTDANNREPPMDDSDNDAVEEPWEPGLRRRRGGPNSTINNGGGNSESQQENNVERRRSSNNDSRDRNMQNNNSSSRQMHSASGAAAPVSNFSAGAIGGGVGRPSCENIGGAVGVLTSAGPAGSTSGAFGFGGPPSTPYKNPTKDTADLFPVTPSSITTAGETAESTLATEAPLNIHRRRSSSRRSGARAPASSPSLRRQYHLLRSQILLLLGSASVGLLLFLFYALPLAAFVSLALMTSSIGALFPVARSIIRARYEMELQHPQGLTRYLPDSLRVMLTETTLHEFMTDDAFFMEYRYLMLYFIPGLQPEQVMGFINQLPPRHRDALLRPGLGRLMPSVMENLMSMDDSDRVPATADPQLLENGDDASSASGLTIDREHQEGGGENDEDNADVTLLDAVTGLGRTLAGVALDNVANIDYDAMQSSQSPITNTTQVNIENHGDNQDDDNSSIAFSIDLSAQGLTDSVVVPSIPASPARDSQLRNVIVEMSQSDANSNHSDDENDEEIQRRERDIEGRILSEAASAAVANFTAQATSTARETATEALANTSSWGIRAGALTGFIAGGGGIMAAFLANHRVGATAPLYVNLGIMSGLTRNAGPARSLSGSADGSSGNENGAVTEYRNGHPSFQWVRGLFVTSAFGFVGAGVSYFIRNQARAVIAENRAKRLEESPDKEDGDDKA